MGFWSKLGQTALRAAPYVAAPFTGGASLTMAGTANNLADTWANKNAQSKYEKTGIAPSPSKFDQFASMAGNIGAQSGGFGGFGGRYPSGNQGGGMDPKYGIWERNPFGQGQYPGQTPPYFPTGQGGGWQDIMSQIFNRGGQGQAQGQGQGPIGGSRALPQMDLRTPNLGHPLLQGINQGRARRQLPPVSQEQYTGYNW
jgi:hypothetical protein